MHVILDFLDQALTDHLWFGKYQHTKITAFRGRFDIGYTVATVMEMAVLESPVSEKTFVEPDNEGIDHFSISDGMLMKNK